MKKGIFCSLMLVAGLMLGMTGFSQNKSISGKVTDAAGVPVAGASITVRGADGGVTSKADGSFELMAPANATLHISIIGYSTLEVAVAGKDYITATLSVNAKDLNEIVVTALGVKREKR